MKKLLFSLENLDECFPKNFTAEQIAKGKTLFYKALAKEMHTFYQGKMQSLPKTGLWGYNWFNVWYTPGVSSISTSIKEHSDCSFELSNRGNLVAVVSDSTRVLGDGDCGPSGGLGVMEGKAFLMKYLANVDAVALCIDNRGSDGKPDPQKIIDFVKMVSPSFGAINLEDISQPNCYKVLDELRENCDIPVWHDDAQGTACVILAGIFNSLKLVKKRLEDCKIVLLGSGASNTTVCRFLFLSGADPQKTILFNSKGALSKNRDDIKNDERFYQQWELCENTNPECINDIDIAMRSADILIALSTPGPNIVKKEWIKSMNEKSIVFVCANPIPEIYPYAAKEAGAYIVATGRGDFPNQVNNSLGFPGILKGTLLTRAKKITDNMAIAAARALADFVKKSTLNKDYILPLMTESEVFAFVAEAVAQQAIKDKVARVHFEKDEVKNIVLGSILKTKNLIEKMNFEKPSIDLLQTVLDAVIDEFIEEKL
ncbi:MAG: NADP-dependent malic enzyme [Candidatus Cloacimonetes bacterium]|nr:NADP-dependent malic enzyme [Candidatus Cloacimonadota bacterium]